MLLFIVIAFSTVSCTENVPVGYVGMITTTNGLQEEVYNPGNVLCWHREESAWPGLAISCRLPFST